MVSPSKTAAFSSAISWQDVANNTTIISSNINTATKFGAAFGIKIGRESGTAFSSGGPNIRIEASFDNTTFIPIFSYQPQIGSSIANTITTNAANPGDNNVTVSAATNIATGDILFLSATGPTSYEIVRVKAVVSSTIYFEEVLTQVHSNNSQVTSKAEELFPAFDVTPYSTMRVVIDNAISNNVPFACQVTVSTFDSIG